MSVFELRPVTAANLTDCAALLCEREMFCVSLMSRFVSDGSFCVPKKNTEYHTVYKKTAGDVFFCALFMVNESGLILHCIPESAVSDDDRDAFCHCVVPVLKKTQPYCIMGDFFGSQLLLEAYGLPWTNNFDYELFEYPACCKEDGLSSFCKVKKRDLQTLSGLRRCSIADAEILYPLQRDYEIEEVLPFGETHSRVLCMSGLKQILQYQQIFAVFDTAEIPVAKAGTNAQGFAWSQIGGVYTVPEWRGKGLACSLVEFIAQKLESEKKRTVLFVKSVNIPAKRAYIKAGFVPAGDYSIIYF